jgi:hypothetical protein
LGTLTIGKLGNIVGTIGVIVVLATPIAPALLLLPVTVIVTVSFG